jgi:hypothetical protein
VDKQALNKYLFTGCCDTIKQFSVFFTACGFLLQAETLASQALQEHPFLFFYFMERKDYLHGHQIIQ